jgi:hypothetical protein
MNLTRATIRHRRGELIAGDEGRSLIQESVAFMIDQDVKRPDRMLDMLSPTGAGAR